MFHFDETVGTGDRKNLPDNILNKWHKKSSRGFYSATAICQSMFGRIGYLITKNSRKESSLKPIMIFFPLRIVGALRFPVRPRIIFSKASLSGCSFIRSKSSIFFPLETNNLFADANKFRASFSLKIFFRASTSFKISILCFARNSRVLLHDCQP